MSSQVITPNTEAAILGRLMQAQRSKHEPRCGGIFALD